MSGWIDQALRRWPALAMLASAAMLAIAHAFQTLGGLAPCTLCLRQRQVYWAALAIAAAAAAAGVAGLTPLRKASAPWFGAALTLTFLTGGYIAAYHAGAEWKWWPGPAACAGGGGAGASIDSLSRLMAGARIRPPSCDVAAWRFLGLSMAGWNVLISVKLAVLSGAWSLHNHRQGRAP